MRKIIAVLLLSFPLPLAGAESLAPPGLPLSGRIFSDVYFPARDLETSTYRQASTSLWLQGDPKLGEYGFARFILTGDAIESNIATLGGPGGSSSPFRGGLREGYIGYAKLGFEFRVGRQILPWGKSDAINPTDFLTAKDFTFFNPDTEVQRVGATCLWLNWTPSQGSSPWSFTLVGTPVAPQTRLLIPPSVVPTGISLNPTPVSPPQTLGNTETAARVAYNGTGWDASLSAFRGFNHIPEFAISQTTVNQVFHHIRALGSDGSFSAGKWVFRGETSYVWTENNDSGSPVIEPSHWDAVVGTERPLGEDFRIQSQLVYRYIPGFTQAQDPLSQANALLLAYQDRSRLGASLRFGYSNEQNGIDAEIFVLGNFVGGDYLLRPKASYAWTDALKTTLGIDYYGGPDDRPLGALKPYNSVFTEAKYSF